MFITVTSILYFFSALASEIWVGVMDARAAASARGKGASVLSSGSAGAMEEGAGELTAEVNPMFLSSDKDTLKLGADRDSLVASILAQKQSPPLQLWLVFRDEFASLVERLKETGQRAQVGAAALQKLEALQGSAQGKRRAERSEVKPTLSAGSLLGEGAEAFVRSNPLRAHAPSPLAGRQGRALAGAAASTPAAEAQGGAQGGEAPEEQAPQPLQPGSAAAP